MVTRVSGVLAVCGPCEPGLWETLLGDLAPLGPRRGSWVSDTPPVRLGRAQFLARSAASKEEPVVLHDDCAVVLDGWLAAGGDDELDSERVASSYRRWGDECVRHLDGEFAFVLWDRRRQRLVAGCDVVGRRTLAYYADGDLLVLSSRATSILRDPRAPRRWNPAYIADVLGDFWVQPPGTTPFESIRRIRPGSVLTREHGRVREREIEAPERSVDRSRNATAHGDELWRVLDRVCANHARSVPRSCIALSGGLDSAVVSASLLRSQRDLDAFGCVFDDGSDEPERRATSAFLLQYPQVRWQPVACDASERPADDPLPDDPVASAIAFEPCRLRLVEDVARRGFTTVFDGEGGDELFGLCDRVGDLVREGAWGAVASHLLSARLSKRFLLSEVVFPLVPGATKLPLLRRAVRAASRVPPWATLEFARWEPLREAISGVESFLSLPTYGERLRHVLGSGAAVGAATRRRLLEAARGVEAVSPLLDRAVVEHAIALPAAVRSPRDAESKPFLRSAGAQRLPQVLLAGPKSQATYMRLLHERLSNSRLPDELSGLLLEEPVVRRLVDVRVLKGVLEDVRRGGPVDAWTGDRLLSLVELLRWMRRGAVELALTWPVAA
jgi:asparagine synthase (glutamine-hydrolysing)